MGSPPVAADVPTTESPAGARRHNVLVIAGVLAVVVVAVAAWALLRGSDAGTRAAVSAEGVRQMDATVRDAARRNTEFEESLGSSFTPPDGSAVFTDDAVWSDWGIRFIGRDRIVGFLNMWALTSSDGAFRDDGFYAGRSSGASTEAAWNMPGWTKASPSRWITEWQFRDGKVASVVLLADLTTMQPERLPPGVDKVDPAVPRQIRELTSAYASAWSSGDAAAVGELYAADAVREDMVFGDREESRDEIGAFASRYREWYPDAQFAVVAPYGVGKPAVPGRPVAAAELTIAASDADGSPCTVKAAVFLETKDGLIASERVYYDADSLVACGWAK